MDRNRGDSKLDKLENKIRATNIEKEKAIQKRINELEKEKNLDRRLPDSIKNLSKELE